VEHQAITSDWSAVITAGGDAPPGLREAIGTPHKSFAEFGGLPSVAHVVEACLGAGIERIAVVAEEEARGGLSAYSVSHAQPGASNIQSAKSGMNALGSGGKVLFVPGDSPLLRASQILHFISRLEERLSVAEEPWFAIGFSPKAHVEDAFPGAPYRYLRLREGKFASGALLAASTSGFDSALRILEDASRNRKSQLRLLLKFGPGALLSYFAGRLSLAQAEQRAARVLGGEAIIVPDCHPASTYDIDTLEDWRWLSENYERLRLE